LSADDGINLIFESKIYTCLASAALQTRGHTITKSDAAKTLPAINKYAITSQREGLLPPSSVPLDVRLE
jgi:hypothetical protein